MRKWIALGLLTGGVGLSASFGSRLGADQTDLVRLQARVDRLGAAVAALEACAHPSREGGPPPAPEEVAACQAPIRTAWAEAGVSDLQAALAAATAAADRLQVPAPGARLSQWAHAGGLGWLGGLTLILVGAVLGRRAIAAEASGAGLGTDERVDFRPTVEAVVDRVERLAAEIADLPVDRDAPRARATLEDIAAEQILPVVDLRGMLIARHGVGGFAEYFGPFSAGERNLARAWSALTDGRADVAREALSAATTAFRQALTAWDEVDARA